MFSASTYVANKLIYAITKGNDYSLKNELDKFQIFGWGPYTPGIFPHIINSDYDLVHGSTFPSTPSYIAFKASRQKGIPYIYAPYLHYNLPWILNNYVLKTMVEKSTALIARTESEKKYLIKLGGNIKSIFVIPSLFDFNDYIYSKLDRKSAKEDFGFEGNFIILTNPHPLKGGNVTLEAAGRLSKTHSNVTLVSMGNPKRSFLKKAQNILKCYPNLKIKNFGWVDNLTKWKLHAAADIFCMPSITDSFGLSYLDSWANKTPVIGARETSAVDLISDSVDGFLISHNDSGELLSRLEDLYTKPSLVTTMGRAGKEKVELKYNSNVIKNLYIEAFEFAISS
ncbi:MAG: glycosyltransferase family 4 protein [Thermoplasmatales archaeon]